VELPSIPTTAKIDRVQLAGIAAAQAAEQLAKAEEKKKRKAGLAQGQSQGYQEKLSSSISIGGGGKKVRNYGPYSWIFVDAVYQEIDINLNNPNSFLQGLDSTAEVVKPASQWR
jgi:hypothetical protein